VPIEREQQCRGCEDAGEQRRGAARDQTFVDPRLHQSQVVNRQFRIETQHGLFAASGRRPVGPWLFE